ncbi:MAG: tetratricopeptide repeat protein [Salinibacter sp.]
MTDRRLLSLVVLFGPLVLVGCAGTTPSGTTNSTEVEEAPAPDSVRHLRMDRSTSEDRKKAAISALQDAYVSGDYETVVRGARKQLQDSLSAAHIIQLNTLLGRAEQARGQHKRAIEALRTARVKAFEEGMSVVHIDRALGESFAALYRWAEAASAFQRVLEAQPGDRATRQALAEAYRRSRDWKEAKQQYTQLVRRDSSSGQWWARLAKCEIELGEIGQAISHFENAHELLPRSVDVALFLSRFYRSTMRPQKARRVVDSTLAYRMGDSRLWRRKADLAYGQDQLDVARRAYEQAIATGDSTATPYRRIGIIDVKQDNYERALSALHQSLQQDSTHSRTTLYLGISYLNLDSLQRATTYLQRTIDLVAQGPITEAYVQQGAVHDRRENVAAAVRAYKTALRLRPKRTNVYFRLATLYDEYYKEKLTAARYYRRFLQASDSTQKRLRTYAQDRLETLRPTLHMQEEGSPPDSAIEE